MFKRGVALFVSCAVSSVAFAGATIELVPNTSGPYSAGDRFTVDVWLSQDPSSEPIALRMVQFDVSDTEINEAGTEGLSIQLADTLFCGQIRFWDFSATVVGGSNPNACGTNHYVDGFPSDSRPCCPKILAIAYGSDMALGENIDEQFMLPANGDPIRIGVLNVRVQPETPDGTYTLDVINADNDNVADPDLGAQVRWGFGTNIGPGNNPLTNWRAGNGLSGGTLEIVVSDVPPCAQALSSTPGCDGVLPRIEGNLIRIQYDSDPTPQIPSVLIQELLSDGLFGADVTSSFDIVNVGGNVLKLTEKDPVDSAVQNDTWYGITDGCNEIHFVVKYGDVNGDGATNAFDVNDIWGNRASVAPNESPFDINGDGAINAFDVNDAWGNRGPTPDKPSGHDICPPSP